MIKNNISHCCSAGITYDERCSDCKEFCSPVKPFGFVNVDMESVTAKQVGEHFIFSYRTVGGQTKTVAIPFITALSLYNYDILIPAEPEHFLRLLRASKNAQQFVVQEYEKRMIKAA